MKKHAQNSVPDFMSHDVIKEPVILIWKTKNFFEAFVIMKSFSSHNRNFYVVGTSNVQRNVKKDQKINEEKNILTRVCFVFSPQFIKSSLENSQAITCFSRWYSRNHGTSTVQQRKSTVNEKTLSSGGSREGPEGRKKFFWRPPPPPLPLSVRG